RSSATPRPAQGPRAGRTATRFVPPISWSLLVSEPGLATPNSRDDGNARSRKTSTKTTAPNRPAIAAGARRAIPEREIAGRLHGLAADWQFRRLVLRPARPARRETSRHPIRSFPRGVDQRHQPERDHLLLPSRSSR